MLAASALVNSHEMHLLFTRYTMCTYVTCMQQCLLTLLARALCACHHHEISGGTLLTLLTISSCSVMPFYPSLNLPCVQT